MRAQAAHSSEMVSMLLFGEEVDIIETAEDYFLIENVFDQYRGYVPKIHFETFEPRNLYFLKNEFLAVPFKEGSILLSKGALLSLENDNTFIYQGMLLKLPVEARLQAIDQLVFDADQLLKNAYAFVGTPYLWGGRTRFGIDCSGFVQLLFKEMGIHLKRDAKEQVLQGNAIEFIKDAQLGDLAFFANKTGKVTHVGLLDGKGKIIHSSGQVRVDTVDEKGIFNADLGAYTHELCAIRRFV
jgi:cell wall-associated NlpC family hydrolase